MTATMRAAIYLTSEEEESHVGFGGGGGEQTTDDTIMMMATNYYCYYYIITTTTTATATATATFETTTSTATATTNPFRVRRDLPTTYQLNPVAYPFRIIPSMHPYPPQPSHQTKNANRTRHAAKPILACFV